MDKPIDLTPKERRAAERAAAEKVTAEVAPLFHDADLKAWSHLQIGDHWEAFAVDSEEMRFHLPEQGGTVAELKPFINVTNSQFVLIQGRLLSALRAGGPYPLAILYGEAGSAKSMLGKTLRSLVDPNSVPLVPPPRDSADLDVAAMHSHVLVFDNISKLSQRLSDSFCRLSTGGGNAQRQFYTASGRLGFHLCVSP